MKAACIEIGAPPLQALIVVLLLKALQKLCVCLCLSLSLSLSLFLFLSFSLSPLSLHLLSRVELSSERPAWKLFILPGRLADCVFDNQPHVFSLPPQRKN